MNTEELTEYYLCVKITNPRTAVNYQGIARRFSECCPHSSIEGINFLDIKKWKDNILEQASTTTWNTYLRHMKAIFNFANKKLIQNNPFEDIAFAPVLQKQKKTIQNGSITDIIQIIQHEPVSYPPNWFWIRVTRFLYLTGIRRRQLIHILWQHIDFNKQTLLVCSDGSKNYKERKLPLPDILMEDLTILLKKHKEVGNTKRTDQVFNITRFNSRYHGSLTNVDQVSGFYKRLTKKMGITVSTHRLRHTMASQIGNSPNANILALSDILGHSDLRITRQYVEMDLKPQRELLNKLEQNLTKAQK